MTKVSSQRKIPLGFPENEAKLCHRVILQRGKEGGALWARSGQSLVEVSSQRVLMPWSVSSLPSTQIEWPSQVLKNSCKSNNSDTGSWDLVRARRNDKALKIWVELQQDHLQKLRSNTSK